MLCEYFGTDDLDPVLGNHILQLGSDIGFFEEIAPDQRRRRKSVLWPVLDMWLLPVQAIG